MATEYDNDQTPVPDSAVDAYATALTRLQMLDEALRDAARHRDILSDALDDIVYEALMRGAAMQRQQLGVVYDCDAAPGPVTPARLEQMAGDAGAWPGHRLRLLQGGRN